MSITVVIEETSGNDISIVEDTTTVVINEDYPSISFNELIDVDISSPVDTQSIRYNASSGKWENSNSGTGDMTKVVYDPTSVNGDAFDMDNMVEGSNNLILSSAERASIASALQVETDPVFTASQAFNITSSDITNLSNLSGVNTGDQSSSDFTHNSLLGLNAGTDYEHLTQAEKDNANAGYVHSLVTTGNPHMVSLEQARAILNQLNGDIDFNNNNVVDVQNIGFKNGSNISWNTDFHTLNVPTGLGPSNQVGQEEYIVFYNDTGASIPNGTTLRPVSSTLVGTELIPTFELAKANYHDTVEGTIVISTMVVPNGTVGIATRFGRVSDIDTSMYSVGDDLYVSATTAGEITNVRPEFPDYEIKIGGVIKSDVLGQIAVSVTTAVNNTFYNAWDGGFRETIDFKVSSDGTTVTGSLANISSARDLTMIFSDGNTMLDCTPACTITLTAGSSTIPQTNYVYIPMSTKVLTVSTSDWPQETEHIKVAQVALFDAGRTQLEGAIRNQNWNDHIKYENDNGHLLHITERLRQENSKWDSGCEGSVTISAGGINSFVETTSGIVYQLHRQNFPVFSMVPYTIDAVNTTNKTFTISDDGDLTGTFPDGRFININSSTGNDGLYTIVSTSYSAPDFIITVSESISSAVADGVIADDIHVVNDFTTPSISVQSLTDISTDASGNSLNNTSHSIVVWGIMNKSGQPSHLMANMPVNTYNKNFPDSAVQDASNYSVYTIPKVYQGVGFLIARFTFVNSGGTVSLYDTEDLRGKIPNTTAGGGAGGSGVTTFLGLTDTPSAYTGQSLNIPRVNVGETGIEFTDLDVAISTNSDVSANTVHRSSDGTDHSFINQSITTSSTPTFSNVISSNNATSNNHLVRLDQMNNAIQGVTWQTAVINQIDFTTSEPVSPTTGDRYINTVTGTSSGTSQSVTATYIYEWSGSSWDETIATEGMAVWDKNADTNYTFNGTLWVEFGSTVSHNNTSGLQGGTNNEYYHLNANDYNGRWQSDGTNVYNTFGNVGIGTTIPSAKLDVNSGNILIDNEYKYQMSGSSWEIGRESNPTGANIVTSGAMVFDVWSASNQGLIVRNSNNLSLFEMSGDGSKTILGPQGNVGIGTTSPNAKLDVNGNIQLSNSGNILNEAGTSLIKTAGGASYYYSESIRAIVDNNDDLGHPSYRWHDIYLGGQVFSDGTADNYFMGNVGIGTSSPQRNFHVSKASSGASITDSNVVAIFENSAWVGVDLLGTSGGFINFGDVADENAGVITYRHTENRMDFGVNGGSFDMTLTSTGLGLGTVTPSSKLEVQDGTITIDQNTDNIGLNIDTEATTQPAIYANIGAGAQIVSLGDADSSDGSNYFYRNLASGSTNGAVVHIKDNSASDDQSALLVTQSGSGAGISITNNGVGDLISATGNVTNQARIIINETGDTLSTHYAGLEFQTGGVFSGGLFKDGLNNNFHLWIDGTRRFEFTNTGDLTMLSGIGQLLLPQNNDATTPTLAFGDGDSGFYEAVDDTIRLSLAGIERITFDDTGFYFIGAERAKLKNVNPSSIVSTLIPRRSDDNTGIGSAGTGQLSLIAGGTEGIRITTTGANFNSAGVNIFNYNAAGIYASSNSGFQISDNIPTSTAPNYIINRADSNTGIGWAGADQLSLIAGGTEIVRATTTGLTIGAYTLPLTDGTSSQVLSTNGSGVVSWSTPSAGGSGAAATFERTYSGSVSTGRLIPISIPDALAGKDIKEVRLSLLGLPTGQSLKVDVRKSGTLSTDSIFTSDVEISVGTAQSATNGVYTVGCDITGSTVGTAGTTIDSARDTLSADDILWVYITQVGSTISGSDLVVSISVA